MMQIRPGTLLLARARGGREQLLVKLGVRLKLMHELSSGEDMEMYFHGVELLQEDFWIS